MTVSGEASDNLFQYTGRENDGTGLYYYRARYYSPDLQRFISEDPIGLFGGINLYAYVENNAVNLTDPSGLFRGGEPPLPPTGLPGEPPEVPYAEDPPRGRGCEQEIEMVCDPGAYICSGEPVKDKCFVEDIKHCYCLHESPKPVLKCPNKTYRWW